MPPQNYMTFPTDFASAVLQVKNSLAQKSAEIRELQDARETQRQLDLAKLAAQQNIAAGEQNIEAARARSASQMGNRELGNREIETQFRIDQAKKRLDDEREARKQNVVTQIGEGLATFVPPDIAIPPEMLQGPDIEITTPDGKKETRKKFTSRLLPDPGTGGHFVLPVKDELTGLKIDKLTEDINRTRISAALGMANIRKAQEAAETMRAKRNLVGSMTPQQRLGLNKSFIDLTLMADSIISNKEKMALAEGKDISDEVRQLRSNPMLALPESYHAWYKDLWANANDLARTAASGLPKEFLPQYRAPTTELGRQAVMTDPIAHEIDALFLENKPVDALPGPLPQNSPQEFRGFFNIKKGPSSFKESANPMAGPDEYPAIRRWYFNDKGARTGYELRTLDGRIIHAEGSSTSNKMQAPKPFVPTSGTPPPSPPASDQFKKTMDAIGQKILDNQATPEEIQFFDNNVNKFTPSPE